MIFSDHYSLFFANELKYVSGKTQVLVCNIYLNNSFS